MHLYTATIMLQRSNIQSNLVILQVRKFNTIYVRYCYTVVLPCDSYNRLNNYSLYAVYIVCSCKKHIILTILFSHIIKKIEKTRVVKKITSLIFLNKENHLNKLFSCHSYTCLLYTSRCV